MSEQLLREIFNASGGEDKPTDVLLSDQSAGPAMWETGPYTGPNWERE